MNMTTTFEDFCDKLMADDHPMARLEPEGFAADFSAFFGLSGRPTLGELTRLYEMAGIGKVSPAKLPWDLRGIHYTLPDGSYASTIRRTSERVPASLRYYTKATRSSTRPSGTAATMRRRSRRCAPRPTGSRRRC